MPEFSQLFCAIICPSCGAQMADTDSRIRFQWGAIPTDYQIGDSITWVDSSAKRSRTRLVSNRRWNRGDPDIQNLFVLDSDAQKSEWKCADCGRAYDAVGVQIEDGVIVGVKFIKLGELPSVLEESDDRPDVYELIGHRLIEYHDPSDNISGSGGSRGTGPNC